MSVLRPRPPEEPLGYHVADAAAAAGLVPRLEAARQALLADPADVDLAARMLADYDTARPASELFAILGTAREIRDSVDRLVVVAGGSIGPATRLLAASCCHPFHDQLPRGERGGRPRLSWLDGRSDNDLIQGLLDILAPAGGPGQDDLLDRWALMPVDLPADDSRQEAVVRLLLEQLAASVAGDRVRLAERVVPVAAADGALAELTAALACPRQFQATLDLGAAAGVFSAAGLLPAAVAGIDVVRLLKGGEAMLRRFAEAPVLDNPPLLDAAVAWRETTREPAAGRRFLLGQGGEAGSAGWLAPLASWLAAISSPAAAGAGPVTRLTVGEPRRDRLDLPPLAESPRAAATVTIVLPRVDEHAIGQLLQLLILSAAMERQLEQPV